MGIPASTYVDLDEIEGFCWSVLPSYHRLSIWNRFGLPVGGGSVRGRPLGGVDGRAVCGEAEVTVGLVWSAKVAVEGVISVSISTGAVDLSDVLGVFFCLSARSAAPFLRISAFSVFVFGRLFGRRRSGHLGSSAG